MGTPYKPGEAVVLFVQGPAETGQDGAIFCASTLGGVYYCVANPNELEFKQQMLTARQIPWDNFGQATGDLLGFGCELARVLASGEQRVRTDGVTAADITELLVPGGVG